MFWAWEQHKKWRKEFEEKERARQRASYYAAILPGLRRVSQRTGIPLAELLPEEADRHCPTCGQPVMEEQAVS